FPWNNHDEIVEAWNILEDYYERGVFNSIGISNFKKEHIDVILEHGKIKPAVNQIKSQVGEWNDDLIAYNHNNDIATVAWSPLRGIDEDAKEVLENIGKQYGKSYAQVVL